VVYKSDAKNLHLANKEKKFKSSNRKFCRRKENLSFCQQRHGKTDKQAIFYYFLVFKVPSWI
jgi:hypothetical protein